MAHGLYCIHCGHNETSHSEVDGEDRLLKMRGYNLCLNDCPGYESEDPEKEFRASQKNPLGRIGLQDDGGH